jgi:sugar O-acyltransferase (sialic acid O-acetyltransferase NeuD family)
MRPLLILGAGAFALETLDIAQVCGGFRVLGFVNSVERAAAGTHVAGVPVFWIDNLPFQPAECLMVGAIGSPLRRKPIENLLARGYSFASVVHPSALISPRATIREGCVINAGVVISHNTVIEPHVVINRGSLVGHDCRIGSFCTVGPGVNIAGFVEVGRGARLGIGAIVCDRLTVGEDSVISAGALVTKPVPANSMVGGSPARRVKSEVKNV